MQSKEQNNLVLACDIGATNFRLALFEEGEMVESLKIPTPTDNFLDSLKKEIEGFRSGREICALALSLAGPVRAKDTDHEALLVNIKGKPRLTESNFTDICEKVVVVNDALAATYAEYFNDPRKNIIYITISTGIGVGVISNNEPVLFGNGIKEIGHRIIKSDFDFECACGGKNHWEAYCSGKNLVRFYIEWAKKNGYTPKEFKEAKEIFLAAKEGGESARRFLDEGFGEINRRGIKMVIDEFSPEKIVFGGSVAYNNQEEIRSELLGRIKNLPEISFTEFGDDISLIGVAHFATKTV